MASGQGIWICVVSPTPARGGAAGHPGLGADMPMPNACPARHPGAAPPPLQVCIKRGDCYTPVHSARLDLGDHRATLTAPGGSPLVIATPMVAKASYNKATGGPVLVPSALGAQQLRAAA